MNSNEVQVSRVVFKNWEGVDFSKNRLIQKRLYKQIKIKKAFFQNHENQNPWEGDVAQCTYSFNFIVISFFQFNFLHAPRIRKEGNAIIIHFFI